MQRYLASSFLRTRRFKFAQMKSLGIINDPAPVDIVYKNTKNCKLGKYYESLAGMHF